MIIPKNRGSEQFFKVVFGVTLELPTGVRALALKNFLKLSLQTNTFVRIRGMRQLRKLEDNARYHVCSRAIRQFKVLDTPAMKELFQSIIRRAKKKYRFRIENFCILGNHFHMIIQPSSGENLSRIMQWILSRFGAAYNKKSGYTGPVWGVRFFSKILYTLRDLIHTFNYIDDNPVKAGLVFEPVDWQYGGLRQAREGCYTVVDRLNDTLRALFHHHQQGLLSS